MCPAIQINIGSTLFCWRRQTQEYILYDPIYKESWSVWNETVMSEAGLWLLGAVGGTHAAWPGRGRKELWGVMEIFCVFLGLVVTPVNSFVKGLLFCILHVAAFYFLFIILSKIDKNNFPVLREVIFDHLSSPFKPLMCLVAPCDFIYRITQLTWSCNCLLPCLPLRSKEWLLCVCLQSTAQRCLAQMFTA